MIKDKAFQFEKKFILKALPANAGDVTISFDNKGIIRMASKPAENLFGYSTAELTGKPLEILIPEAANIVNEAKGKILGEEVLVRAKSACYELTAVKKDRSIFPIEISVSPVKIIDSILVQILVCDISARKKLEEKYLPLLNSLSDAIVIMNEKGIIQVFNRNTETLFGYNGKELTGRPAEVFFRNSAKHQHVIGSERFLKEVKGKPMSTRIELKAVKKNGRCFSVEISLSPLQTNEGSFISACIRDITNHTELENKFKKLTEELEERVQVKTWELTMERNLLRTLIDNLPDFIYVKDTRLNFIICNRAAIEFLGLESEEEIIGKNVFDLFETEYASLNYVEDRRISMSGKSVINRDEAINRNGKNFWLLSTKIPIKDSEGNIVGLIGIRKDITERKKAEKELRKINEDLHRLSSHLQDVREEERIQIARDIHDELGQQLTGLKMGMTWLNKKLGVNDEAIKKDVDSMVKLIDETVNSVRRISSNLRPSILDDLGLIAALEWHSAEVAKRSKIKVTFIADTPEPAIPDPVATGIFRIFQELLTNAVRHSNADEIKSRLRVKEGRLILEIKDDGQGMDSVITETKKTLGLIGIKERTFVMGGKLDLKSQPGKGTYVKIAIPL